MLQLNNLRLAGESKPSRLEFPSGQISVVLGRNNSGKTNLLRLVAGLTSRATAEVTVDGQPLAGVPAGERPVGFVFQAFVNYPHWSVRANIESPLIAAGKRGELDASQRKLRVLQIARTLQIEELLDRKPAELSGGQQQRLAIGRALAADARVLLLDEPFVNLDFRLRERLTLEFANLLRETGTTVLFASSDCRDAFALADSVVLLDEQQVLQSGAPLSVYRQPVSLQAADLMSEPGVNWLVDGAGIGGSGIDGSRIDGSGVEVVRPEHLQLVQGPSQIAEEGAQGWLRYVIEVESVETNGSHTFVQGALRSPLASNAAPRWVARLTGMPDLSGQLGADNTLELWLDPRNQLHLPHGSDVGLDLGAVGSVAEVAHGAA